MHPLLSRTMTYFGALCAATLLGAPAIALENAAETAPAVSQNSSVEGVTEYTLGNGLRVLLAPDDSKPTTTVNMTYLVGSRNENYGETGMAHLLEHMMFRGTPTVHNALAAFSRRGLQANGSTSNDRTSFYASFAANPETLDWFIGWQADAMVNSLIAKQDLKAEMPVVRNEMERDENSPFQVLMQEMQSVAYQWHNYGHATIGARSDVEHVDVKQLHAFYKEYYQPDNAVLIVSGKFDPKTTLQVIETAFEKIPKPTRILPAEYTVEPVQDGERQVTLRRHGGSPLIAAMFHIPALASPDYTPLDLGVDILSDTPSGRLYHALVEKKLSTNVFGFTAGLRQPGYALLGAQLESGMDQQHALKVLDDTIDSIATQPFTQTELDRVKNQWLTDWTRIYSNPTSLAGALSDAASDGDWRLFFLERDRVKAASLADVQRATRAYLVPSNRTDGLYIPTENPVRAPASMPIDLAALFKNYHGERAPKAVAAFNPTPANIDARTMRSPLSLPNGEVKLALLPKPTNGDRVQARLLIQFGTADSLKGYRAISFAAASLLDHGTSTLSRQEIQDKINALQASVDFGGSGGDVAVDMTTTREHLPDLIKLVLGVVRNANFPADELAKFQRQVSASIKNSMNQPSALASRTLERYGNPWPSDDIRYTPTFEQALKNVNSLTRQELVDFHQKFYGAGHIEFAAVGAFDPAAVKAALSSGLKDWRKAPAFERISDPYHAIAPKQFKIDTPDKANAFYLAVLPIKMQDTNPDYPALYLANYLLGGAETSRLWNRVRVQDGLSYNIRSSLNVSPFEPSGAWTIYAIQAPENSRRVESDIQQELLRALRDGFTDKEVSQGIHALLNYRKLARTQDGTLASAWINYLQSGRSFEWSEKIDRELAALTPEKVNAALRATLAPDQFSSALAGDSKKENQTH